MRYHVDYHYIAEGNTLMDRVQKALTIIKKVYKEKDIPHQPFRHVIFMTKGATPIKDIINICQNFDFGFKHDIF